jgi:hypothetical protein
MRNGPMKKMCAILLLITALIPTITLATSYVPEKHYRERWCSDHGGQVDVLLADGCHCECLTETHAVEFEFAPVWASAVGKALCAAVQTGKKAGVVLILKSKADLKYWLQLNSTIKDFNLPIDTWMIEE